MTQKHAFRLFATVVAIFALALLVGCKGGSSCERDFDDPAAGAGGGGSGGGGGTGGGGGGTGTAPGGDIGNLFQKINDARQLAGVSALQWDSRIAAVAESYASYCAQNRTYSPNLSGTPSSRLRGGGVSFNQCDETGCHDTFGLPFSILDDLDRSKLTNPAFHRVGIGYKTCHYS